MKYTIRFLTASALAQFIAEFVSLTRLNFDVEEDNNGEFVMTIYR